MDLHATATYTDWTSYKFRDSDTLHAQSHPFTALKLSNVKYLVQEAREKGFFFVRKILPGDWLKRCSLFDDSAIKCLDGKKVRSFSSCSLFIVLYSLFSDLCSFLFYIQVTSNKRAPSSGQPTNTSLTPSMPPY